MIIALSLANLVYISEPPRVSFREYELGMSLDDFRAKPLPDERGRKRRVACAERPSQVDGIPITARDASAGVVRCSFQGLIGGKWYTGGTLLNSSEEAQVLFSFHRGKLFEIELWSNVAMTKTIEDGLRARYGTPKLVEPVAVQTVRGSIYPGKRMAWFTDKDEVQLLAPDRSTTRVSVFYRDATVAKEIAELTVDKVRM